MLESRFINMDSYRLNFSVILTRESVRTFHTERLCKRTKATTINPREPEA
jgi:hypothetical protein